MAEWIELTVGTEASLGYPTLCWKGIRVSSKIKVRPTSLLTFFQTLDFIFPTARPSTVASIVNIGGRSV